MRIVVGVLSRRDLALLRATAAGRCELVCGTHPDLLIDGLWCCDQTAAAHTLAAAGLLTPTVAAPVGARVPAALTGDRTSRARRRLPAPRTGTRPGGPNRQERAHRAGFPNTHQW